MEQVTWIILLFEQQYSVKASGVTEDEYTTFLGAFNYDASSDSLLGENDEEAEDADYSDDDADDLEEDAVPE